MYNFADGLIKVIELFDKTFIIGPCIRFQIVYTYKYNVQYNCAVYFTKYLGTCKHMSNL